MEPLTSRQQTILDFIRRYAEEQGLPPTRAEIAAGLGFRSVNAAVEHLHALARKGAIELLPGASRGIRLPAEPGLPVIGSVAAGSPLLAIEHVRARCRVDPGLFTPRADYLLEVRGASMREAGILDGDWLAVHRATEARNGQIVVARLGEEVTVKRLFRRGARVELRPENPDFAPIVVDVAREPLAIEGVGVGVIRPFAPPRRHSR